MSSATKSAEQIEKELNPIFCRSCGDVMKEILKEQELKQPLRRIIIIGNIMYSNQKAVEKQHEQLVAAVKSRIKEVSYQISGILVIHENFFYHICEGSDEFLADIIEGTAELAAGKTILGAKFIHNSGTLQRFFKNWNACRVKTPSYQESEEKIEVKGEESSALSIAQMIKKLEDSIFVLASFLKFVDPEDFEEKINELVPIGVLLSKKELVDLYSEKFFLTVQEYVETYLTHHDYVSFLEQEWPPTGPIHEPKVYFEELDRFEEEVDKKLPLEEENKKMKAKPGAFWWTVKTSK